MKANIEFQFSVGDEMWVVHENCPVCLGEKKFAVTNKNNEQIECICSECFGNAWISGGKEDKKPLWIYDKFECASVSYYNCDLELFEEWLDNNKQELTKCWDISYKIIRGWFSKKIKYIKIEMSKKSGEQNA